MVNSPVIPDSELVLLLSYSIAKSRPPGAYDAHKSVPAIRDASISDSQSDLDRPFIDRFPPSLYSTVGVASPPVTASHLLQPTPWTYLDLIRSTKFRSRTNRLLLQNPAQQLLPSWAQQQFRECVR
jgi:hypothetical protein